MPTPIREKDMKDPDNFTENTQPRHPGGVKAPGGARHVPTGAKLPLDVPNVPSDDIDNTPYSTGPGTEKILAEKSRREEEERREAEREAERQRRAAEHSTRAVLGGGQEEPGG